MVINKPQACVVLAALQFLDARLCEESKRHPKGSDERASIKKTLRTCRQISYDTKEYLGFLPFEPQLKRPR